MSPSYMNAGKDLPEHSYFKDVNHLFDNFVGTWTGSQDWKDYRIVGVKKDQLLLRYKIRNKNGQVLASNAQETLDSGYVVEGVYFSKNSDRKNVLNYSGFESDCGQYGISS